MQDNKTYFDSEKLIDEVLVSEPAFSLSDDFAERMAKKTEKKFAWNLYIREFLVYLGALAGIVALTIASALIINGEDWKQWLGFLVSNISWIAGINFVVVFILFTDRVLLRYFLYKSLRDKSYIV